MSRGGCLPVRAHSRTSASVIASMSFMSIAPRPQTQPSLISPPNGSTDHSSLSAGTTSRWPWISSGARLLSVPSMRAIVDARPLLGLDDLRLDADLVELAGDPFGGGPLGVGRVGGVDADQVGEQVGDLVLGAVGRSWFCPTRRDRRCRRSAVAAASGPDHVAHGGEHDEREAAEHRQRAGRLQREVVAVGSGGSTCV